MRTRHPGKAGTGVLETDIRSQRCQTPSPDGVWKTMIVEPYAGPRGLERSRP